MKKYRFTAQTAEGTAASGMVRAAHPSAAKAELYSEGLTRVNVVEKRAKFNVEVKSSKVTKDEVLALTWHLHSFLSSGLHLVPALEGMAGDTPNVGFQEVLSDLSNSVSSGLSFGDALANHPKVFTSEYVAMVRAAEAANRLADVLEDLAGQLEREDEQRSRLKSATVYPMIVLVMAILTVIILVVFALPKFTDFFDSLGAELPLATRMLINVANFAQQHGLIVALGIAVAAVAATLFLRTEKGKFAKDRLILKIPVVKGLIRSVLVERFCRVLASMLAAGVSADEAVALATAATNNRVYQKGLASVREAVLQGEGIGTPLARTNLFPANVCQVVNSGEFAGTLPRQLTQLASSYAKDSQRRLTKLMTYFEPILLGFVAVIVGFVAIAMVSAMYGAFGQMK